MRPSRIRGAFGETTVVRTSGIPVVLVAAVAALGAVLVGAAWREKERVRHLAVPVLEDPSAPTPPGAELADVPGCTVRELVRVPGRVTALLRERAADDTISPIAEVPSPPAADDIPSPPAAAGGKAAPLPLAGADDIPAPPAAAGGEGQGEGGDPPLWIGTFDGGLYRLVGGELEAVPGLRGRELFVNALAEHDGLVWAATQGGVVGYDAERRAVTVLRGEGVTSLARAGRVLYAGTARGVYRVSAAGGAEPVEALGPSGEPLRVTALAATERWLWIGTASGAYSLPLATAEAPLLSRTARWHPLVFGDPPAETNVVTALAQFADGAIAGTDDGGVVRLREDGGIAALRLADARANEVSPGAAGTTAAGEAVVGTQGGGALLVRRVEGRVTAGRLGARTEVSAVLVEGERVLVAAEGVVGELRCGP